MDLEVQFWTRTYDEQLHETLQKDVSNMTQNETNAVETFMADVSGRFIDVETGILGVARQDVAISCIYRQAWLVGCCTSCEAAEASFALVVQKAMRTFTPHFKRIRYNVEVSGYGGTHGQYTKNAVDASHMEYEHSEATIKLALPSGRLIHEVAEGNGPVAALDAALRKSLEPIFPNLQDLHLVDYKVRVVKLPEESG